MLKTTAVFATLIVLIGPVSYLITPAESRHITIFIPSFFGGLLLACVLLSLLGKKARMIFMHLAVLLALLGASGIMMGGPKALAWVGGTEPDKPRAVISQLLMGGLSLALFVFMIQSFIEARKSAKLDAGAELEAGPDA